MKHRGQEVSWIPLPNETGPAPGTHDSIFNVHHQEGWNHWEGSGFQP